MDGEIIPYNARVVVADARKALLLRNAGNAVDLMLEVEKVIEAQANAPTREQGTDRPGKVATGSHRSSLGQTDYHQQDEDRFLVTVAKQVEQAWGGEAIRKIYVVAPPRALATLRKALPPVLAAKIVFEVDKDLVNLPLGEIEKHLK